MTAESISRGKSPSPKHLIPAVVVVAATLMAVPLSVAYDSHAFTDGEIGYVVRANAGVTYEELTDSKLGTDSNYTFFAFLIFSSGGCFNTGFLSPSNIERGIKQYEQGAAGKVDGKSTTTLDALILKTEGTKYTFDITSNSEMIVVESEMTDKYKAVIDAIKAYFGTSTLSPGDRLEISGDMQYIIANKLTRTLIERNDTECVIGSEEGQTYLLREFKQTITYTPNGGQAKSITYTAKETANQVFTNTYDYKKPLSEVVGGSDEVTITPEYETDVHDCSIRYHVDGQEYVIDDAVFEKTGTHEAIAGVSISENIKVSDSAIAKINSFADTEHLRYEKGYSAADSMFESVCSADDPADEKPNLLLMIAGIVAGVVVIGVIAFFVIRRRA